MFNNPPGLIKDDIFTVEMFSNDIYESAQVTVWNLDQDYALYAGLSDLSYQTSYDFKVVVGLETLPELGTQVAGPFSF